MLKKQENLENGNFSLKIRILLVGLFFLTSSIIFLYVIGDVGFYCPFNYYLNFKCLTCNSTTAFRELINGGSLLSVLNLNPLFFFWVFVYFLSFFDFTLYVFFNKQRSCLHQGMIFIEKHILLRYLVYVVFIMNLFYLNLVKYHV